MENFRLVLLKNGVTSLCSVLNDETFHPEVGPEEEARVLHVEQQRIVERAQKNTEFTLWDVGLGAAANALTAIRALRSALPGGHLVTVESFDQTTAPLEFALKNARALGYAVGFEKEIREVLDRGSVQIGDGIRWNFHLGDFCEKLCRSGHDAIRSPDAIFYDPYSAKTNTAMWSLAHFTNLFGKLDPDRPVVLTNYTNSTYVRVTLLLAGFYVGFGRQVGKKLHTTIASSRLKLLDRPLDRDWLYKRVRVSHSAAAIKNIPYEIAPISEEDFEKLTKHPQFA